MIIPLLCLALLIPVQEKSDQFKQQISGFRNKSRFTVKYDKFNDLTSVTAGPFFVGNSKGHLRSAVEVSMSARFEYQGVTLNAPPKDFYLIFHARGIEWEFLTSRHLVILADGERIDLGEGEHDGDVRRGGVSEVLIYELAADTFQKIAKARTVDLKIGRFEMSLKDEHSEAFRDLLSLADKRQSASGQKRNRNEIAGRGRDSFGGICRH
jgi:hypothetical protein